jgi:hypothetical protein
MFIYDRRGHVFFLEVENIFSELSNLRKLKQVYATINISPLLPQDHWNNYMMLLLKASAVSGRILPILTLQMRAVEAHRWILGNLYLQNQSLQYNLPSITLPLPWYPYFYLIDLSGTELNESSVELLNIITKCASLSSLVLRNCRIKSIMQTPLAEIIRKVTTLKVLDLSYNFLTDECISALLFEMQDSQSLIDVSFSYNNFSYQVCESLVNLILKKTKIRNIQMAGSPSIRSGVNSIVLALLSNGTITSLDLGATNLSEGQKRDIETILVRNCSYEHPLDKYKLRGPAFSKYPLLSINSMDDINQKFVDHYKHKREIIFGNDAVSAIGSKTIANSSLEISDSNITLKYKEEVKDSEETYS